MNERMNKTHSLKFYQFTPPVIQQIDTVIPLSFRSFCACAHARTHIFPICSSESSHKPTAICERTEKMK